MSTKTFDPKKSIHRAKFAKTKGARWSISVTGREYVWGTRMDRVAIIRTGLPYESIEIIGKQADLPVKKILQLLEVPQTTYNKKKRDKGVLNRRDSELILMLTELLEFGLGVFNNEGEKFKRWLKKPNASLGDATPESLFDSFTGIQEVKNSLNRLEYGNMA